MEQLQELIRQTDNCAKSLYQGDRLSNVFHAMVAEMRCRDELIQERLCEDGPMTKEAADEALAETKPEAPGIEWIEHKPYKNVTEITFTPKNLYPLSHVTIYGRDNHNWQIHVNHDYYGTITMRVDITDIHEAKAKAESLIALLTQGDEVDRLKARIAELEQQLVQRPVLPDKEWIKAIRFIIDDSLTGRQIQLDMAKKGIEWMESL